MNLKNRQRVLLGLLILLLVFGIFSVIYSLINHEFDAITYLSGCSTFVIALLTVVYVLTISKQLDIMAGQLEEMKRDHELQNQPLPWIYLVKVFVEMPRFFFSPPALPVNQYNAQSRYRVKFTLKNIGRFPGVCIDVSSRIAIPQGDKYSYLGTTSVRIDTLEEKQIYPYDKKSQDSFLFTKDHEGALLKALRENDLQKYPHLLFRVLYKNVLGGCFALYNEYRLYPENSEQDLILKNWLSQITSFRIQYKKELDSLNTLRNSNSDRWEELFVQVKTQFADSLNGEDIKLRPWPIPGTFRVKPISSEEYVQAIANISYGILLPSTVVGCPAIDKINK